SRGSPDPVGPTRQLLLEALDVLRLPVLLGQLRLDRVTERVIQVPPVRARLEGDTYEAVCPRSGNGDGGDVVMRILRSDREVLTLRDRVRIASGNGPEVGLEADAREHEVLSLDEPAAE